MNSLRKRKFLAFLLVAIMLVISFAGCSKNSSDTSNSNSSTPASSENSTQSNSEDKNKEEVITLRIYTQYADEDTKVPYDYAVEELAKAYPNVKLELDIQSQDDGQKLQTYAATGNLPDIFQVGLSQINTFKESDNILVLDDYLKSTGFGDKVHTSAKNILYAEDGHVYAFPFAGNELVIWYYNKDLFKKHDVKVPENYDELLEAVKKFKEAGITPLSLFAKEKWPCVALYDTVATSLDPDGIAKLDRGEGSASDEAYKLAAERVHELVEAGLLPNGATNLNYDQAASLFYEEKAAMFVNGQWEIEASTEKLGDKVDWMFYPTNDAGNEKAHFAMSGGGAPGGFGVSPHSEHKELAVEIAAFISEKYCEAKYIYRSNPLLAVKIDPSLKPVKPFPPMMEKLDKNLANISSTTKFAWGLSNPKFKVAIEDQSQFLLTPGYTPEEFIEEVDKVIERTNN